ncbi:GTPase Era [Bacteroidota bacterium]
MMHKAGFVNIIGNPNVGKSTLMNRLVGEKLSIITPKAQTTRHRIIGIVNGDNYQIVLSDTPGIINPKYKLQESMMIQVKNAVSDADVILYMTDVIEKPDKQQDFITLLKGLDIPVIVLINKIDLADLEGIQSLVEKWKGSLEKAEIYAISALHTFETNAFIQKLVDLLPESPPYYPPDALTDKSERFFVSEIIREKILINFKQEIPYSVEIEIEEFKEQENLLSIRSIIYVAKDSQKNIIIGKNGSAIKNIGIIAREDIEKLYQKKVFLELFVKVKKEWRNDQNQLKRFGYLN